MGDKGRDLAVAGAFLIVAICTIMGLFGLQRRIDTLARQVEILERDGVNHGARLDARTMAGWR
jgi:hypothetical protein